MHSRGRQGLFSVILLLAFTCSLCRAEDWYRWRGPRLDGISAETGWFKPWKEGPKQVWKAQVGQGFSTVSVAKNRLFTSGQEAKVETITCLDASNGRVVWQHRYTTTFVPQYYEGGSSGTPIVDGDHVFYLGQMGELFCFEAASGKVVWSNQIAKATGTKEPTWGLTGAPVVSGNLLLLNVGDAGTAVEKATGKVVWTSKGEGGYASPVLFGDLTLFFGTKALAAVETSGGKLKWEFPWKTTYDVNAADPVVVGADRIFISSDYNHGCALLDVKSGSPKALWQSKELKNPYASSVLLGGYAYGIDGYAGKPNGTLRCLDLATGTLKWSEPSIGMGALMAADNKLIIISERGELVIAQATPDKFTTLARAQVLGGKCWTVPVLSNGRIYARNSKGDLVCLDATAP